MPRSERSVSFPTWPRSLPRHRPRSRPGWSPFAPWPPASSTQDSANGSRSVWPKPTGVGTVCLRIPTSQSTWRTSKVDAALSFTQAVLETRGGVSDADVEQVRAAGYSDGEIAEIIAHVALSVLTNYVNRVADTEVDFPRVAPAGKAARDRGQHKQA